MLDGEEEERICYCGVEYDEPIEMLQCHQCLQWFHALCVGFKEEEAREMVDYACATCLDDDEPGRKPRRSDRKKDRKKEKKEERLEPTAGMIST
jgi:hypothetical protein